MTASSILLDACKLRPADRTPVWLMRQAGRYMESYRQIRRKVSFLDMCRTPKLACEVTLEPVEVLGVDGAIIFADILLPLFGMGIDIEFGRGDGPQIRSPVRAEEQARALRVAEPEKDLPYVLETVGLVRKALDRSKALIGFAGAPFTLASYVIEGGHSRNYAETKRMMHHRPVVWAVLMEKLSETVSRYLRAQIKAGCEVVQVFDSWAGCLSPADYKKYALPYSKRVFDAVKAEGAPSIHFATDSAGLLGLMREAGGDVIGVDWRIDFAEAWKHIGHDRGIQGNLDPAALLGPAGHVEAAAKEILRKAKGRPGHIFNLGHGVLPETPVENAKLLVKTVHDFRKST